MNYYKLIETEPENIYKKPLGDIYGNSSYLQEIRSKLVAFQNVNTCENCINQYYKKREIK